jgi:hypothetical protein
MAVVPNRPEGWNLETIERFLAEGVFESRLFDFKEALPVSKDDAGKQRLRKTLAAFANSEGGFLIIGVKDGTDLDPADRLVGTEPNLELQLQIKEHAAACTPHVRWTFRHQPLRLASGRVIHVFHVPESKTKPHGILDRGRWIFPKRTDGGNESLSYEEIRHAFRDQQVVLNGLRMIRAEAARMKKHSEHLIAGLYNQFLWRYIRLLFRPAVLEAAVLQVVGHIGEHPTLESALGDLRSNAAAADAETTRLLAQGGAHGTFEMLVLGTQNAAAQVIIQIDNMLRG